MNPLVFFDYAGVAVFAATGALAASRKQLDILGFIFLAAATGIGGGTLRDLVLGVPVFWTVDQDYILVCAALAVVVYFWNRATSCSCGSTPSGSPPTASTAPTRASWSPARRRSPSSPAS